MTQCPRKHYSKRSQKEGEQRLNVLLIYPQYPDTFWSFKNALRLISKRAVHPPLGLLTVAAMLPERWHKRLIDMNVTRLQKRDLEWADCVFIGAMAVQKKSVMEVIKQCKEIGVRTIAGGPLFTASPEEFEDIDHLVLGEAELTLPCFLRDFEKGEARHIYKTKEFPSLSKTPIPMWELIDMKRYVSMTIQYSRGCPFRCEFCDITTLYGRKTRTKSIEQVIKELEKIYSLGWRGGVFFVDDNFIGNKKVLKKRILPAIIHWMESRRYPFEFATEASINLSDDDELMRLMVKAGFESVFIGIETTDNKALQECSKFQNINRDLVECVKKIQKFGLNVRGGFIVGFDNDSSETFDRQIDFIQKSTIITAMVGILNAPRGSRLFERLECEGRIIKDISGDNTDFTTNIIPKMGYEKLYEGYKKVIKAIYSPRPYYERVKAYLKEYDPIEKRRRGFDLKYMLQHINYFIAPFKATIVLGIIDDARRYYWKLTLWSLLRRPRLLPQAITYSIYGFHFRKVFGRYLCLGFPA